MVAHPEEAIQLLQINLHHCSDANDAVVIYAVSRGIDIILCQDPYVVDGVARGIPPEWPIFFSSVFNSAIFCTNKDYAVIKSLALNNSIIISINVCNSKLLLYSQYSSPSGDIDKDFVELSNNFSNFDDMLIAGDFNVLLLDLGYTRQTEI